MAELRALLAGPRRDRGRFAAFFADRAVTVAPCALADAPGRLTGAVAASAALAAPVLAGRAWALRLATAARQDLWRACRRGRGAVPVVCVRLTCAGAEIHAALAFLDGATAAPGSVDVIRRMLHDGTAGRWRAWADGADSKADGGARCSTRS